MLIQNKPIWTPDNSNLLRYKELCEIGTYIIGEDLKTQLVNLSEDLKTGEYIYDTEDEGHGCLRMIGWKDNRIKEWTEKDFETLMGSEALFARKFTSRHIGVVGQILNEITR